MASGSAKEVVLEVQPREVKGGTACKRMRREGRVPGNVYGLDRPPFQVSVNPRRIDEVLRNVLEVHEVRGRRVIAVDIGVESTAVPS